MLFLWILAGVVVAVVVWLAYFSLLTYVVGKSRRQREFLDGKLPSEPPDGFYRGSTYLLGNARVPWLGKSFKPEGARGMLTPFYRHFRVNADGSTDAYHFKTGTGPAFRDKGIDTLKLDYDLPENPFLIRIILDEVVEVAPQEFLGKVHVKVFPGYYATIGFFGLQGQGS